MKKVLMFILSVCVICCCVCFASSAMSKNEGLDALRTQFFSDSSSPLDYVAYSPVKEESDAKKYPLIVWTHGKSSGDYPGHQLIKDDCDIALWSSEEYQSRFKNAGGAFLLLLRCPTDTAVLPWGIERRADAKKTIDDFIAKNPNVDVSRIYLGGYSLGGKMVYLLASEYPEFFAAVFPMSATYPVSSSELRSMKSVPMWLFTNVNDYKTPSVIYSTSVKPIWDYYSKIAVNPQNSRMTTFEVNYRPDGSVNDNNHNTWNAVIHDLFMDNGEPFPTAKTVDGNGNEVTVTQTDSFISWLSSQSLENRAKEEQPPKQSFFQKIFEFLKKIFELIFG